jgi:hypothetical protein
VLAAEGARAVSFVALAFGQGLTWAALARVPVDASPVDVRRAATTSAPSGTAMGSNME